MADCEKCLFASVCKKRPKMPGAKIAECNTFRERLNKEKPMTNADRIRAMSDEELADFITNCGCPDHARDCRGSCTDCVLEWLKQPAEEESNQDCTYNKNGHCIGQKMMPECDAKNCDRRK